MKARGRAGSVVDIRRTSLLVLDDTCVRQTLVRDLPRINRVRPVRSPAAYPRLPTTSSTSSRISPNLTSSFMAVWSG